MDSETLKKVDFLTWEPKCKVILRDVFVFTNPKLTKKKARDKENMWKMVLILYGNLDVGAHIGSNICYLSCLRHLINKITSRIFYLKRPIFPFA